MFLLKMADISEITRGEKCYHTNFCLWPTAKGTSNYLSCSCCCSSSGLFVNLHCCMKSNHFSAMFIKIKLLLLVLGSCECKFKPVS